ncbi:2-hydroxychromene-2-carboxylate isomerase [Zavarzinia sp.]|uniref:2-hydroxychromene-2-carboxylate isomerase n=1 Tax=Zavarzinia sp. TaxID=2027920 RepID=UPI003569FD55
MTAPIDFFFDFASPYAYCLADSLAEVAARHGRSLRWRPILLWAVLKQHGMPPPLEHEVKRRYVLADMARSARFFGKPEFRMPDPFPVSTHLPARLFHHLEAMQPDAAVPFARAVLDAAFRRGAHLADAATIAALAGVCGVSPEVAAAGMTGDTAKEALRLANEAAAALGVWGSPFVVLDGDAFFGADRLPQIEARLEGRL